MRKLCDELMTPSTVLGLFEPRPAIYSKTFPQLNSQSYESLLRFTSSSFSITQLCVPYTWFTKLPTSAPIADQVLILRIFQTSPPSYDTFQTETWGVVPHVWNLALLQETRF
jgi:hypothetical protein